MILRGKKSRPVEQQGAAKGCERDNDCEELEVTKTEELAGCETKCELSEVSELSQPSHHTKCSRCNFCYKARLEAIAKDKYLRNFLPYQILRGPPSQRLNDTHFYDGEKAFPECKNEVDIGLILSSKAKLANGL